MNTASSVEFSQKRMVIFLHIPKAGGTTLANIMRRQYGKKSVFTVDPLDPVLSVKKGIISTISDTNIKLIAGHMRFGLHKYLPCMCNYITMVRNPIDRIISHYYYVLRSPKHYLHDEVASRHLSLEDYVSSGISKELNNDQTILLSGYHSSPVADYDDMLELAKRNLKKVAVVGITERFDESILLMKRIFGWKTPFYIKANVTKGRLSRFNIPRKAVQLIEEHNSHDLELYNYAIKLFKRSISKQGDSFAGEFQSFKVLNRYYSLLFYYPHIVKSRIKKLNFLA